MGPFSSKLSATTMPINNQEIRSFIESENSAHAVVVWSKSYCPYCSQTKSLFQSLSPTLLNSSSDIRVHELDRHPQGGAIQQELQKLTGQRTVPNVFVRGTHVGGNDDTRQAHRTGALAQLLQQHQRTE